MTHTNKHFLDICAVTGRDPKTIREPKRYVQAWYRAASKELKGDRQ